MEDLSEAQKRASDSLLLNIRRGDGALFLVLR